MPTFSPNMFATSRPDDAAKIFIDSFVQQAQKVREEYENQWEENWANYRVEPFYDRRRDSDKINPYADRNSLGIGALKTPESHQIANTLVAVMLASLFGVRDYVQAEPIGDEDIQKANVVSRLIMFGLERSGNYRTQYDTLRDSVIFGTGAYRAGWHTQTRSVPRRVPIPDGQGGFITNPETGLPLTVMINTEVPVRNDFKLYPVNLWKMWFDPSKARVEDMDGIVEQFTIAYDELAKMKASPAWAADGINRVLAEQPQGQPMGPGRTQDRPKLLTEQLVAEDVKEIAEFGYYGGWRYTGMLPSELARRFNLDPNASALVSVIGDHIVQATQNPQKDGELPYGTLTILPNTETPYGLSPLTVIRYLQDVSDTQLILTVQAMIEAVYQNYIVGGAAGAGPGFKQALERRMPRQAFMLPGDVTQIQPLPKDYQGLTIAAQGLALLSQTMRDASNARDPVSGIASGGESTATEVSTVASAALQNVDQLSILIERDELPRQGKLCYDAYYVNLDDEGMVIKRVGDDMATEVSFFDIDGDFDIKFVGARNALSRASKATQFRDFLQLMLSNPLTAASLNINELVKRYADEALDVRGLEQMIIADPEEVVARLQAASLSGPIQPSGGGLGSDAMPSEEGGEPLG